MVAGQGSLGLLGEGENGTEMAGYDRASGERGFTVSPSLMIDCLRSQYKGEPLIPSWGEPMN